METITIDTGLHIELDKLKAGAKVFRAIRHPVRSHILYLLHKNTRMTVTDLYTKLSIDQAVASFQLGILRREGLVITEREGKHIYYAVNYKRLAQVQAIAAQLIS